MSERKKTLGNVGRALEALPDAAARATHKGREIAKLGNLARQSCGDFEVEIRNFEAIDRGVQYEARAWKDGEAVGFGKDGSVEWERFRIINPPILVERDGEWVEDLEACIIDGLAHTLKVKKERFNSKRIAEGKVGHTTTTVYPDANPESTSVDGYVREETGHSTWSDCRDAASGTSANPSDTSGQFATAQEATGSYYVHRAVFLFDASAIDDSDTVSSATMSLYGTGSTNDANSTSIVIVSSAPASNTNVSTGDYDSFGTTSYGSKTLASYSTSAYNDITVNATGIAAIALDGVTKFGTRNSRDVDDVAPVGNNSAYCYFADETGTTKDPKLVIEHAAAASGPANVKTYMDIASASVKTIDDIAIASVKTWNDIA